jgi:hypothetical protein
MELSLSGGILAIVKDSRCRKGAWDCRCGKGFSPSHRCVQFSSEFSQPQGFFVAGILAVAIHVTRMLALVSGGQA